MHENSKEIDAVGSPDFPAPWIKPSAKTFSSHAQHVACLAKPQPVASINGITLFLPPNVYHPGVGLSSSFLVEAVSNKLLGASVLDLGCGSGYVGISLYRPGMELTLADISDAALASAAENLHRMKITAEVVSSDLFSGLQGRLFDTIFFNPPLFDKAIDHEAEIALCDPDGELLGRFLADVPDYLNPDGKVYFMASNLMNRRVLLHGLKEYQYEIVSSSHCAQSDVSRWVVCASPIRCKKTTGIAHHVNIYELSDEEM
ncbi:methyltransferase [Noviherbaspirillum saxi]|uniref:Methyltransferase domain-containing protein n=1 Tax=Noviherbaspirillum saxi TaxID=2320863 RepID=A0A3A3FSY3_9BURK|nr:methyltransferase [Noviherbaspirillum saxi]RJF99292.1 methyltransferase domain-containing protein [Noviherbaspirillum saxi]